MTELSEHSFSDSMPESGTSKRGPAHVRPPAPLWKFRASLAPNVVRSLKSKILPRIFLAKKPAFDAALTVANAHVADPIDDFAALTLSIDAHAASDFVDRLLARGVTVEAVFLQWLAPAARRLGDDFCGDHPHAEVGESVLLTVVPGEQHSFGLSMVAEFFRRDGWNLCTGPFDTHRELTSLVHNHWFDVVGFSVSSDRRLDELKRDIQAIRSGSRNRLVGIILGGPMMEAHPDWVDALGADMMSVDAISAPQQAHDLIGHMKGKGAV